MASPRTAIEWTDATWNPTTGCDRTSPGCDNCYALTLAARLKAMGQARYQADGDPRTSGPGFALTLHPDTLDAPRRWKAPRRIFVNSMSDLLHRDVPPSFIRRVAAVMADTPRHTYQILTKRSRRLRDLTLAGEVEWPPNAWVGVSVESQNWTFRIDHLRATPADVRWISAEPLIGPIPDIDLTGIDWLVAGGESGQHHHRPPHPDWVRSLRDAAAAAAVPFHFKQWGGRTPKAGGRTLDGRTHDEFPPPPEQQQSLL